MRNGFTLIELMAVVIIIGILSAIAIPRYGRTVEKSRQAEATSILGAMRGAQLRFAAENAGLCTTNPANLDIDLPDNNNDGTRGDGRYFNYTVPGTACNTTDTTNQEVAIATRNGFQQTAGSLPPAAYTLTIMEDGAFTCGGGNDCAGGP